MFVLDVEYIQERDSNRIKVEEDRLQVEHNQLTLENERFLEDVRTQWKAVGDGAGPPLS